MPPFPLAVFDLDGTLVVSGTVRPVPGVVELVEALDDRGVLLAVATSASTATARRVLAGIGLGGRFAAVTGRGPDGVFAGKDAVVAEALLGLGVTAAPPGSVLLGDGPADLAAARRHGLVPVGVAWGASSAAVLRASGAHAVLEDPAELWSLSV